MSAAGEIPGKGCEGEEARFPRMDLLGPRRPWLWRFARAAIHPRACPCRAWRESHGPRFHRRSLRGFFIQGASQGGIRESIYFTAPRGWIAIEECLHRGGCAVRAPRKQAIAQRNSSLPRLSGARTGNLAASSRARVGENCLGRLSGNFETTRTNRLPCRLPFFPRRGMHIRGRFAATLRRLSSEPTKHTDRARDRNDVRRRAEAHPGVSDYCLEQAGPCQLLPTLLEAGTDRGLSPPDCHPHKDRAFNRIDHARHRPHGPPSALHFLESFQEVSL